MGDNNWYELRGGSKITDELIAIGGMVYASVWAGQLHEVTL